MDKLWEITLGDLLDEMAEKHPNHDCVIYTDRPFRTTYQEFRDLVNLAAKGFKRFSFPHLRTGIMAGSPCPVKVMQQVADEMNMREITIVYGLTEASPGCTQTTTDDPLELRVSTVGRSFPFVETKVVDPDTGLECPPGVVGEFIARGYNIMKGYYKMPEATAQAIDQDGWLHSGDLATCDEKGYYKITGRIKDIIIRGGRKYLSKRNRRIPLYASRHQ